MTYFRIRPSACIARDLAGRFSLGSVILVASLVFAIGGCTMPERTWTPSRDPNTLDATTFLHYLASAPVVTLDEGCRAVLLLSDDGARFPTFERRRAELIRRGALKETWRLEPNRILDKGTLAYMLRVICELPPGVNEGLLSGTNLGDRRYALKACVHAGLMAYGLSHEPVKGGELVTALTQAEDYMNKTVPAGS